MRQYRLLVSLVVLGAVLGGLLGPQGVVYADGPLTLRYSFEGTVDMVVAGVGLEASDQGDITLTVPAGATVVQAYLYWSLFDDGAGDNQVDLAVDGGTPVTRVADAQFGPDLWYSIYNRFIYVEDVTAQVLAGTHTYTISDVGAAPNTVFFRDGAGLVVVYSDPSLPQQRVEIRDGLDSYFEGWTPPRGPNSEVACTTFPADTVARTMNYYIMIGGVATTGAERPIALWSQTGNGTQPANLVNQPVAVEVDGPPAPYPFFNADGLEWDTYRNTITIQPGDTYACFQVESVPDYNDPNTGANLLGASGVVLAVGGSVPMPAVVTPPTNTPTPTPTNTPSTGGGGNPTPTPQPTNANIGSSGASNNAGTSTDDALTGLQLPTLGATRLPAAGYPPLADEGGVEGRTLILLGLALVALGFIKSRR